MSLWNEKDPILKSRLWGLTNDEGVHGEDVKEIYYHDDATPTASYMKGTYRYPLDRFPYEDLAKTNLERRHHLYESGKYIPEYELIDTGIFDNNRFYDVSVEYFKKNALDTFIAITVENVSNSETTIRILPTLLFRNTWSWYENAPKRNIRLNKELSNDKYAAITCDEINEKLPSMTLFCDDIDCSEILFCDNETDMPKFEGKSICRALYKQPNTSSFPKNGIDDCVINNDQNRVKLDKEGFKFAAHYRLHLQPKEKKIIRLRLLPTANVESVKQDPFNDFEQILSTRKKEADEFYLWVSPNKMSNTILKPKLHQSFLTIPEIPKELRLSFRRAEAVLNQLITDCSPLVATFHTSNEPSFDPICRKCHLSVRETVEHLLIRCCGRKHSILSWLGYNGRKTVEETCREQPLQVLQFLNNEGLLHQSSLRNT